jgi:DNA-binding transcriptional ArsR family regulator
MALEALANLLRALSDPSRLRLLWLCAAQPAAVSALAAALGETEPTVSRHLKALAAAGILRRTRRGQRVEYSLATGTPFDELIAATLRTDGTADDVLSRAHGRLQQAGRGATSSRQASGAAAAAGAADAGDEGRLGDALALAMQAPQAAVGTAVAGTAVEGAPASLLLGSGCFPLAALQQFAQARRARLLLVAETVAERTAQRRRLAEGGLAGEVVLRGDLPRVLAATAADGAALHSCIDLRALRSWPEAESTLRWLQRLPVPRSADWLLFDYDAVEAAIGPGGRNLPAELRSRLTGMGFETRRIQPIEVDGHHRLFVHCVPRSAEAVRAA